MSNVMSFEKAVETFIHKLPDRASDVIAGKNPNIENYYKIWRGNPDWLDYNIYYPNGRVVPSKKLSLNLGRYVCDCWANNYANENTQITIPNGDEENKKLENVGTAAEQERKKDGFNDRLQEILKANRFFANFNTFVSVFMALGIGATLVNTSGAKTINKATRDVIKTDSKVNIQFVNGRRVYPITIENGVVTECAFETISTNSATAIIHYLENGKYKIAEFTGKGNNGNYDFNFDEAKIINAGDKPLFQIYHPNNASDDDIEATIGESVFATALDAFKQCDEDYTALFKEVSLGQKKIFMQRSMTITDAEGNIQDNINPNDEAIFLLPEGENGANMIQEVNGELRISQLEAALNFNLNIAGMLCGLGANHFELTSGGRPIQTATGVIAKQTELYRNVCKQENFAANQLQRMVEAIVYVNNEWTNNPEITLKSINDIQVKFDDNIIEDTDSKRKQDMQEVSAGIKTIAEYRAEWLGEDEETANAKVKANAMLINQYLPALQSGAMSIEQFIDFVYGEDCKYKEQIIQQLQQGQPALPEGEQDEAMSEDEQQEQQQEAIA